MKLPDWVNEALDLLLYHEKMIKENGHTPRGRQRKDIKKGWSIRDTSKAKALSIGKTSNLLRLGRAIRSNKQLIHHSKQYILRNYGRIE